MSETLNRHIAECKDNIRTIRAMYSQQTRLLEEKKQIIDRHEERIAELIKDKWALQAEVDRLYERYPHEKPRPKPQKILHLPFHPPF